ncbi:MAG: phosphoesterase [Bacilli bacterium]|nr:phosphoesterase [Bacilli bacterium]
MTDIHSHILFDVDDGSSNIEESIELLKKLKSIGFKNVILTPHYIEGSDYCSLNQEKLEKIEILKSEIKKNNIDINIYLGNEIFINDNIIKSIKDGKIYPLNNTKYLLIELPFYNQILNLDDILFEITHAGYIPVIAHPERYSYFQENYKLIDSLRENGVLFQANYSSILGHYGKQAKKLLKYMLKQKYIDYLGTDIHHIGKTFVIDNFEKINKKIKKITKEEYYNQIINNCNNLISK